MQQLPLVQANDDASPTDVDALADETWGPGHQIWLKLSQFLLGQGSDSSASLRLASHIALLFVAAAILVLSQVKLPKWDIAQRPLLSAPAATVTPVTFSQSVAYRGGVAVNSLSPLARQAVPFTTIPDRPRLDIETYVVKPGDTVFAIAEKYNLKPDTIMWANKDLELNPDLLRVNDELVILPVNGVYHEVKKGDTVVALAKKYKVQPSAITGYALNKLENESQPLEVGSHLIIPGGEKPFVARLVSVYSGPIPANASRGSGAFGWPSGGTITQNFWNGHRALDIGSWVGSPVVASDSGYVVYAGWDATGYGNLIVVDHGNGYRTYYAHLSRILVRVGESVAQGQRIGSLGNTGNSTGPHLHFEIRYGGVPRNPWGFLR